MSHYGFRGEALASVIDMAAIVDITSRPHNSTQTFSKLFTYGKEKSVGIAKTSRPSMGTTVTIQDFMYNMPVRRKLIKEAIDIESVRTRLESFALMHPKVSFSLRNDRNNTVVIQTSKSSSTLSTFMQLFGTEKAQGLVEVEHTVDPFTITGYISLQPHMTKAFQFVYVNKRVVLKTKIHKMVNGLLARTSIISNRLHPSSIGPEKVPSSPPKRMNLYGMFLINIECPYSDYDICLDPSKTLVEFKDWDKLLLCIEEMIIKFIQEENLVISLDERYRRTGRNQEIEQEGNSGLSQSSSSCLEMFCLKRSGEESDALGVNTEKYGHTICTQDNLLAVHSLPVKRIKKKHNKPENFNKNYIYSNNAKNFDIHTEKIESNTCLTVSKSAVHQDIYSEENCPQPYSSLAERKFPLIGEDKVQGGCISKGNGSGHGIVVSENTSDGMLSSFKEFKEIIELNSLESDESVNEHDILSLNYVPKVLEKPIIQGNPKIVTSCSFENEDCESKSKEYLNENNSSLDEFMKFYNADKLKTELESYKTPEQAVKHTPDSPPPLTTMKGNSSTSEDVDDLYLGVQLSPKVNRNSEKKSLSKSLSSRWKKHQSRAKINQIHQNFEYQKKNIIPRCVGNISRKKKQHIDQDNSDKNSNRIQHDLSHSTYAVKANVNNVFENSEGRCNGDTGIVNSMFRFQPVFSKKIELRDSTENYLPGREGYREHGLSDDAHIPCSSRSEGQNFIGLNYEKQPLQQTVPADSKCIPDSEEIYHTLPEMFSNNSVEHKKKISFQVTEMRKSLENDSECCQKQSLIPRTHVRENIRREYDETELNNANTDPGKGTSELPTNDILSDLSYTLCEKKLESRKLLKAYEDTDYCPKVLSMSSQSCLRRKNCMSSNEVFISEVKTNEPFRHKDELRKTDQLDSDSHSFISAVSSTQPFEVENILQNKKAYNSLCYERIQENSIDVVQESQGFTPTDGNENLCHDAVQRVASNNISGSTSCASLQKTDNVLGIDGSMFCGEKERDTDDNCEQRKISYQRVSQEQSRDKKSCMEKVIDDHNESQPVSSQVTMDCDVNFLNENLVQSHCSHFPCESLEKKEQQLVSSLFHLDDCKNDAVSIKHCSNNPSDEEKISTSSKSPNPLSESLHFSQLTLPDVTEPQEMAKMASIVNCSVDEIKSTNLSMGSFSLCSSEVMHKAKKQVASCEIVIHGKVVHIGGEKNGYQKGNVENVGDDMHCPRDTLSSSGNKNPYIFSEKTEIAMSSDTEILFNTPDVSRIERIKKRKIVNAQNYIDDDDHVTHWASNDSNIKSDGSEDTINESNDREVHIGSRWKEVCDENARKVFVDIQTGNSLYDPPLLGETPRWKSSQPLGAPLLKIPLTHEPWYKPVGKAMKSRQTFTLSHGFSDLMSWKKTREVKRNMAPKKNLTRINLELSICDKDDTKAGVSLEEESKIAGHNVGNSLLPEVQEAIDSLLKDFETDENTIKWSNKSSEVQQGTSEPSDITKICHMWEAPHFAMDTDILNSEAQATTAERGTVLRRGAMVRVYNIVHPYKFSREMLQTCKVNTRQTKRFLYISHSILQKKIYLFTIFSART